MLFFFLHFRNYVKVKKCSSRADENVKQRKISRYCKWVSSFLSVCAGLFLLFFNRALCQNRSLRRRFNLRGFNFFPTSFTITFFAMVSYFCSNVGKLNIFFGLFHSDLFITQFLVFNFSPLF